MLTTEDCLQLVLDSENDYEKEMLKILKKLPNTKTWSFNRNIAGYYTEFEEKNSLIIMFHKEIPEKQFHFRIWTGWAD